MASTTDPDRVAKRPVAADQATPERTNTPSGVPVRVLLFAKEDADCNSEQNQIKHSFVPPSVRSLCEGCRTDANERRLHPSRSEAPILFPRSARTRRLSQEDPSLLRSPREEVLANGRGLLRVEYPCGILRLSRTREVRAKVCPNELAAHTEFGCELLRANGLRLCHRIHLLPFVRVHYIQSSERTNARQYLRERINTILTFVRSRVRTCVRPFVLLGTHGHDAIPPPSTAMRVERDGNFWRGKRREAEPEPLRKVKTTSWQAERKPWRKERSQTSVVRRPRHSKRVVVGEKQRRERGSVAKDKEKENPFEGEVEPSDDDEATEHPEPEEEEKDG